LGHLSIKESRCARRVGAFDQSGKLGTTGFIFLEEFCHGNIKQQIKNATSVNKYELLTIVNRSFARLRHCPDLILSFFRHARLSVKQL
jgi:hypothetical protein